MYLIKEGIVPNPYKVKPRYCSISNNYQGTTYAEQLNVSGAGWVLAIFQHVGDDDGMTGYVKITIDGVDFATDLSLFSTSGYSGVVRNLVVPLRFNTSLVVSRRVASANTGVGTTIIYDLD